MKPELLERLFEANVKLGKAIVIHDEDAQGEELDDLFHDISDENLMEIGKILDKGEIEKAEREGYGRSMMYEILSGKIVCEVHTPVMTKRKDGIESWSWGHTTYTYIAASSLEELVEKACEWAEGEGGEDA